MKTPKRKFYFIVNPASKSGKGLRIFHKIKPILEEENISYRVYFTTKNRSATHITTKILEKDTSGSVRIIALGGDGTVNEVVQGIGNTGSFDRVIFGYLPTGSSNDLARDLGYGGDTEAILRHLLQSGSYRRMDVGCLQYKRSASLKGSCRYFAVSCGIGFDASICYEALNSPFKDFFNRIGLGKLTYGAIAIKQLFTSKLCGCRIYLDDRAPLLFKNCYFASVMNHRYQGGGFKFCPDATDNDGKMDLCIAHGITPFGVLRLLPLAAVGKHVGEQGIHIDTAKKVRIRFDEPHWVHTDGEVKTKATDVWVKCLGGKLKMMV